MFAIFCIPEATYVKVLQKYILHDDYRIGDTTTLSQRYFVKHDRGFTIVPLRTKIYDILPNPSYSIGHHDSYNNWIWVRERAVFEKYSELVEFCRSWFSSGYFSAADVKEFNQDDPKEGVANPTLDYPNECFEIHEILDNRIVSTASICVCIPTKASK